MTLCRSPVEPTGVVVRSLPRRGGPTVEVTARPFVPADEPDTYADELELRFRVLREPLGMTRADVKFEREPAWTHFVAHASVDGGRRLVGCVLSSREAGDVVQLRQMAVSPELQMGGVGRLLVEVLEARAREERIRVVTMHAREVAVGFYEKLGYAVVGERFVEVGIPHFVMQKEL